MDGNGLPGGAFILQDGKPLIRVKRESFPSENDFQELIAQNPQVLSGDLLYPEDPIDWLLIDREVAIGDSEEGGDRWSVDHVFVDQHGTPTLVEVKRRSDSRLKRDVVGQIFNYVAFASAFLSAESLRIRLEERLGGAEQADEIVGDFIGGASTPDQFWQEVGQKLRAGSIRAMIVADEIPFELRRVLEFMNEKMEDVELLGLELQLYATAGYRTLVPRLVGRTAQAEDRKSGQATRKWTVEEVVDRFSDRGDPDPRRAVSRLLDWADQQPSVVVETGSGVKYPTLRFRIQTEDHRVTFIVFWPGENDAPLGANLYFGSLRGGIPTFADAEVCKHIARRIHDEIDSGFDPAAFEKYPSFLVQDEPAVAAVLRLMDEIVRKAVTDRGE